MALPATAAWSGPRTPRSGRRAAGRRWCPSAKIPCKEGPLCGTSRARCRHVSAARASRSAHASFCPRAGGPRCWMVLPLHRMPAVIRRGQLQTPRCAMPCLQNVRHPGARCARRGPAVASSPVSESAIASPSQPAARYGQPAQPEKPGPRRSFAATSRSFLATQPLSVGRCVALSSRSAPQPASKPGGAAQPRPRCTNGSFCAPWPMATPAPPHSSSWTTVHSFPAS
jgi:hypothetical protein